MSQAILIERFLGAFDPADGALALLALTPEESVEPKITTALERQLLRVARHPQGTTPEADEVRLVLHVAAAQLRDAGVRAELTARWHARRGTQPPASPVVEPPPIPRATPPSSSPPPPPPRVAPPPIPAVSITPTSPSTPTPIRPPARPLAAPSGAFRAIAEGVLVQSGGWTPDARRRLERLAIAYKVDAIEFQRLTEELAGPAIQRAVVEEPVQDRQPVPLRRKVILTSATIALFASSALMALHVARRFDVVLTPSREAEFKAIPRRAPGTIPDTAAPAAVNRAPTASTPEGAEAAAEAVSGTQEAEVEFPAMPAAPIPPKEILVRLRGARSKITNDARGSLADFESSVAELSQQWGTLGPELLVSLHNEVVDYVFDASRRDRGTGRAALEIVLARAERLATGVRVSAADEVLSSAWATGMLNRLRRDRDLPEALEEAINTALRRIAPNGRAPTEQTSAQGVAMALGAMAERLRPRDEDDAATPELMEAWSAWVKGVRALEKAESPAAAREVLLAAIDLVLIHGPDPTTSRATNETLKLLLAASDWKESAGVGARAVAWFDDVSQVTAADLSVVTGWLVGSSGLPGVSPEMVLAPDASNARRMELRDSYAALFGLPVSRESRAVAARWTAQAREMIIPPSEPLESRDALVHAAALARMNEAAAHRWRQEERASEAAREGARAETIASQVRSVAPSGSASVNAAALTSPGDERDGLWARRYLASMNAVETRVELLNELRNSGGPVGPADADVLAETACFGSPIQVRRLAQTAVKELSDNLLVANAMIEALPRAARQQGVSDTLEAITGTRLPKVEDAAWRIEARRAMVNRLLELIAGVTDSSLDGLGELLAASYRARVDAFGAPTPGSMPGVELAAVSASSTNADIEEGSQPVGPGAEQPAGELWELWAAQGRRYAEGGWTFVGLDVLQRRRAGRASLADDSLQLFAAEQASGAEMMGYVVAAERPAKSPSVQAILEEMAAERRGAQHLFAQMEAAERAILRLWMVRFGEEERG